MGTVTSSTSASNSINIFLIICPYWCTTDCLHLPPPFLLFFSLSSPWRNTNQIGNKPQLCSFPGTRYLNFALRAIWLTNSDSHIPGCSKGRLTACEWTNAAGKQRGSVASPCINNRCPTASDDADCRGGFFFFFLCVCKMEISQQKGDQGSITHVVLFTRPEIHFPHNNETQTPK